jgi:hypothetical protein
MDHFGSGHRGSSALGEGSDKSNVDFPVMHLLGISALAIGFALMLILGFLDVAQQLLSRNIFDSPQWSNVERAQEIADEPSPSGSAWKNAAAPLEGGRAQAAGVPET